MAKRLFFNSLFFNRLAFSGMLLLSKSLLAASPVPFNSAYEVKVFGGLNAEAELALNKLGEGEYEMQAMVKLSFFKKTLTQANASSKLSWHLNETLPQSYEYIQTGMGHHSNSIIYDWEKHLATTRVDDEESVLPLDTAMLDELSMYVEIQQQAAEGVEDIHLNVIDADKIKQYHYKRVAEEQLETPLGVFNTVKYLRVRSPDSKRVTELWLASDWGYLVLQLKQKTRIRTFQINLHHASVNGEAVDPLNSSD